MHRGDAHRPRVAFLANALGLGGTEKGLVSFATALDATLFEVSVIAVHEGGARQAELEHAGIPVRVAEGSERRVADLLQGIDIAHVFRAGTSEPLVPSACRAAAVPHLIETNIFGSVDRTDERSFDCHLFMSRMCLMRYRHRVGARDGAFHRRHKVLPAPIEYEVLRALAPTRQEARRRLGLDPARPVVGRVGRDSDLKWRDVIVDMVPHLLERVPRAQVVLVGTTPRRRARLERLGVRERCSLFEPTLDPGTLACFYAACDVFVSAAEIGESQGLALGEAMALGLPVVTCSTPWADNAQVELVEHGRSGWFASHAGPFAEAVTDLLEDEERRRAFGAEARAGVERQLSPGPLVRRLERLYCAVLEGREVEGWDPSPAAVTAFEAEYPRRAAAEYRPLRPREKAEARALRARERLRQARAAVGYGGASAVRDKLSALAPPRARTSAGEHGAVRSRSLDGRPRVVVVRGHQANVWDLRPLERLRERFDIALLVTGSNLHEVETTELDTYLVRTPRDRLPKGRAAGALAYVAGERYLGLKEHLAGAAIVHTAELGTWFSAQVARLKEELGFRLVVTVWETIPGLDAYRWPRERHYRRQVLESADLFLPATARARQALLLEGVPPDRIEICPPGVEVERFSMGPPSPSGARHQVLSAGRLVWEKGHQDVLRALAAVRARADVDARAIGLLVVGSGPEEGRLRRYADDLGLREVVEFRPTVPHAAMPELYASASALVLASLATRSWEEQFGMVLVEAMAAGTPVIAASSGAIPEVVGHDAELFRAGDWIELARILEEGPLSRPPAQRRPVPAERLARFTVEAAAERLQHAYGRACSKPSDTAQAVERT